MVESSCQLDALQEKLKDIRPGDTVVLEDGTSVDQSITIDIDGESDRPIRIRAMNPGKVVLTGQSTVCVTGKHLSLEGLRFERCTLEDSCMVPATAVWSIAASSTQGASAQRFPSRERRLGIRLSDVSSPIWSSGPFR